MESTERAIRAQVRYEKGKLLWLACRKKSFVGRECGFIHKGYRYMKIGQVRKAVHHVVWFLHHGQWPSPYKDIDHVNQDKLDNRIENLREVSRSINAFNNKALNVSRNGNNFRARIGQEYVGTFSSYEEAVHEAAKAKQMLVAETL